MRCALPFPQISIVLYRITWLLEVNNSKALVLCLVAVKFENL